MAGNVLAVVGAQYGSEGKGVIVHHLAHRYNIHVRVGGPNAGHSFYHYGKLYKMQMLPCGWSNPGALLVIGRGAVVSMEQLQKEVDELEKQGFSIRPRLFIDGGACVLDQRHHHTEGGVQGELHQRIGSTGEGVGAARTARMARDPSNIDQARSVGGRYNFGLQIMEDTATWLYQQWQDGNNILLEGTQGSGLSLIHGPWPYVTSADTNAGQLAVDVGLPMKAINQVLLVARTFPIRVAGNSGPLKGEMTWDDLSARIGKPIIEHTTVTKKVRRVGTWDKELFRKAVELNGPTSLAVTFIDYKFPEDEGKSMFHHLSSAALEFIQWVEEQAGGVPVVLAGTGGEWWKVADKGIRL